MYVCMYVCIVKDMVFSTLWLKCGVSLNSGHLKRLSNLNLCDNNLEFPPNHVIKQGTRAVVSYLKDRLGEMVQDGSSSGM